MHVRNSAGSRVKPHDKIIDVKTGIRALLALFRLLRLLRLLFRVSLDECLIEALAHSLFPIVGQLPSVNPIPPD